MSNLLQIRIIRQNLSLGSILTDKTMIRIGRASDCEVSLPDPMISNLHLILKKKEEGWYLEDVSRNGICFENEQPVPSRMKVEEPKRLRLGKLYEIEIQPEPSFKKPLERTLLITQQPTQIIKIEDNQVIVAKAFLKDLRSMDSIGIESRGLSLGSHPSNDVVIEDESVSQFHARIDFIQNEFHLMDLNSTNGSQINGQAVLRAPLMANSKIKLGTRDFEFKLETSEKKITTHSQTSFMGMVSKDPEMQKLFSLTEVVAATDAPVFVHGETGTGKELLAKAIHDLSPRFEGPYLAINCAALPLELMESELFGHEKGAFTGAYQARPGAFEACHNGSLFLDEIAELDPHLQAKLLRTLETGEVRRLGSNRSVRLSVRIISASHKNLAQEVRVGKFREDLFFRLQVVPLKLPALRDRLDDLDLLVPYLLRNLNPDFGLHADALEALKKYTYPGNIRELKNILQRALVDYQVNLNARTEKNTLNVDHFRFIDELKTYRSPVNMAEMSEREKIVETLEECQFNQSEAARKLGFAISTFHDKLKRYGIERKKFATHS